VGAVNQKKNKQTVSSGIPIGNEIKSAACKQRKRKASGLRAKNIAKAQMLDAAQITVDEQITVPLTIHNLILSPGTFCIRRRIDDILALLAIRQRLNGLSAQRRGIFIGKRNFLQKLLSVTG